MAEELKKMAINVEELPDGLIIRQSKPRPAELDGRSDHRIVMALSLVGLCLDDPCCVDTAEAMNVTFPDYVELMRSIGADMELTDF
jgi:3-phosphoshikimate 1-carboxyvinyltransferase